MQIHIKESTLQERIPWSCLESRHEIRNPYNVSQTRKPFTLMNPTNIYCSNILNIVYLKWTNAIIFCLKHIFSIIRVTKHIIFKNFLRKKNMVIECWVGIEKISKLIRQPISQYKPPQAEFKLQLQKRAPTILFTKIYPSIVFKYPKLV